MSSLNTESKMDFDYSVGTEDRFALRKWFSGFVAAQNKREAEKIISNLEEGIKIEGLGDSLIGYEACVEFIKQLCAQPKPLLMRYPNVKVKYQHVLFHCRGSFEGYYDGVLSYDGTFEIKVMKTEEGFKVAQVKFYPRLIIKI